MANIKIGRYAHESVTEHFSGWIEPDDRSWIIYLGPTGKPACYFPERDESGGVVGEAISFDGDRYEAA